MEMAFWGLRMMKICFVAVAGVRAEVRRLGIGTGGRCMKLAWTSLSLRSRCHNCPKLRLYISKKELRKREEWFQKIGSYKMDSILSKSSNNAQTQRPCEIEYEAGTTPEIGRAAWKGLGFVVMAPHRTLGHEAHLPAVCRDVCAATLFPASAWRKLTLHGSPI